METEDPDDLFENPDSPSHREENLQTNGGLNPEQIENLETVAPPKKRIVRAPRLKFDPDRLCGSRGIPILVDHFKDIKFKGKKHEVEDLDCLLSKLEHWTHRLFPSMRFEDTLKQIEKLGHKKPVQVCVTKLRLDMPLGSGNMIPEDMDEQLDANALAEEQEDLDSAFNRLIEERQQSREGGESSVQPSTSSTSLTEEQRLRMQRNRELAEERRRKRVTGDYGTENEPENLNTSVISTRTFDSNSDSEEEPLTASIPKGTKRKVLSDDEDSDGFTEELLVQERIKELETRHNASTMSKARSKNDDGHHSSRESVDSDDDNTSLFTAISSSSKPRKNLTILSDSEDSHDGLMIVEDSPVKQVISAAGTSKLSEETMAKNKPQRNLRVLSDSEDDSLDGSITVDNSLAEDIDSVVGTSKSSQEEMSKNKPQRNLRVLSDSEDSLDGSIMTDNSPVENIHSVVETLKTSQEEMSKNKQQRNLKVLSDSEDSLDSSISKGNPVTEETTDIMETEELYKEATSSNKLQKNLRILSDSEDEDVNSGDMSNVIETLETNDKEEPSNLKEKPEVSIGNEDNLDVSDKMDEPMDDETVDLIKTTETYEETPSLLP